MQTIDHKFLSSLYSNPESKTPTVLDELRNSLGSENASIAQAAQMVSEIHGPYNGSSPVLNNFLQQQSNNIKNIDKNQKDLDEYTKLILENIEEIQNQMEIIFKNSPDSNVFVEAGEIIVFRLSDTVTILKFDKFQKTISSLHNILPHEPIKVETVIKMIEDCLNPIDDILIMVKKGQTVKDSIKKYPNLKFQLEDALEGLNELIGSKTTSSYLNSLKKYEKTYENMAKNSASSLEELTNKIADTKSYINRVNETSSALFDTPLLREFVSSAQQLHPAVSSIILQNLEKFPYFQEISEKVGSLYTITSSIASIDPMQWLKNAPKDFMTNNILRGQQQPKLFGSLTNMITNVDGFMNTLYLRNTPYNHMGIVHSDYSKQDPIAHGYSGAMDCFHAARALSAKAGILPKLLDNLKDRIRLLDSYFPVMQIVQQANQYHTMPIEKMSQVVNAYGRTANSIPLTVNVPLGTKEKDFSGGRDNEQSSAEAQP